jgi:5-methylcytosine-specific restriction protein A
VSLQTPCAVCIPAVNAAGIEPASPRETALDMRAAPKPCTWIGCGQLVHDGGGRCARHRQQAQRDQDARRGSARKRGYTSAWDKAREAYLRKHPMCRRHQELGVYVAATVVDHIVPHKGDMAKFWDTTNWQPLCKTCHDRKTASEDGGWGRGGSGL